MRLKYVLGLILFFQFSALFGQQDSLGLTPLKLGTGDVNISRELLNQNRIVSASRSLQDANELPVTIFVVTKEDILKNGYTTLVDVLKIVPGIRVSQPGSALEGETFIMRGLMGNAYAKILINDVPVKPFNVLGMPLGAQLPIRQAERIEIIYGPGTNVYGRDASAGVINIITNESERPVFTQADLSIGSQGYSGLNVLFGGKLGKDKRVLKYSIFAGTTTSNNKNIDYDKQLFNPTQYDFNSDNAFLQNPNYSGSDSLAKVNELPHQSRYLGVKLKYRSLNFSFLSMSRQDHSALGSNPLAVSYASPLNYIGESISSYHVSFKKDFSNFGLKTSVNVLTYFMDNNSSHTYVENTLKGAFDLSAANEAGSDQELYEAYQDTIFNRFFSGTRYSSARGIDAKLEQLVTLSPNKNIEYVFGAHLQASGGNPYRSYLPNPDESDFLDLVIDKEDEGLREYQVFDYGIFAQMYLTFKKWNAIVGLQYFNYTSPEQIFIDLNRNFHPRLAFLYKINKNFNVRTSISTAFRLPTPFYNANSFVIDVESFDAENIKQNKKLLQPELTNYAELGFRFHKKNITLDASFFYTKTFNLISYSQFNDTLTNKVFLGYSNEQDSYAQLYGVQSSFVFKNLVEKMGLSVAVHLSYHKGKEQLPGLGLIPEVRAQPNFTGKLNVSMKIFRRLFLQIEDVWVSKTISRRTNSAEEYYNNPENFTLGSFNNIDLTLRFLVGDNFQIYSKFNNLMNAEYAGIDASGNLDDLFYNPQPQRTFIFGLMYNLD